MDLTRICIATRRSPLALWQARHVADAITRLLAGCKVEILELSTRGDEVLDRPLALVGGKGLFLKELELALLDGRADLAVHSMKDVPAVLDEGLEILPVLARAAKGDAVVTHTGLALSTMPAGSRIGTSSLRRKIQIQEHFPGLNPIDVRGNLNTRIDKLDCGDFDALILAEAGLVRLGLADRISERLEPPIWLPAISQGALAAEFRASDDLMRELLRRLADPATVTAVAAERALNRVLEGSCDVPVAAWCHSEGQTLTLHGAVGDGERGRLLRAVLSAPECEAELLGERVGKALLDVGAGEIIARARRQHAAQVSVALNVRR